MIKCISAFWVTIFFLGSICVLNSQNFTDVTLTSGVIDVTSTSNILDSFGSGASIADFDNDGDLDVFVGTEFGLTNLLYQNLGNNQFQEVALALGINSTYKNRAALWLDYDGDQLLDLLLLGDCLGVDSTCEDRMSVFLYKQNSDGNFTEISNSGLEFGDRYSVPVVSDALVGGVASGDINNDGYLDVIVTVWGKEAIGAKMSFFLNNQDGTFTDISVSSNLGLTLASRYQPIFYDFNYDGYLDIYINVDFGANEFWLNNGDNTFNDIAGNIGADNAFNEMGMTIGDYDNDGDMDIYSTNITADDNGTFEYNILLKNDWSATNQLGFTEVSNTLNIAESGWDWGTTFFDANNDGFLDLASTNGWSDSWGPDSSKFWLNVDGVLFSDNSNDSGFNDTLKAASLLAFDMDRDGDLDLLQSIKDNGKFLPIRLYENNINLSLNPNNYLVIKPRMNGANHFAIGAVVKINYDNGKTGMRLITAGTSFYGQEPAEAFFGLSNNTIVNEIRVEWPDNTTTVVQDIAANQIITITNDSVLNTDGFNSLEVKFYPNPTSDILSLESKITIENIAVYNLLGQKVLEKPTNSKNIQMSISRLSSGSYFLKLKMNTNGIIKTFQIIKK